MKIQRVQASMLSVPVKARLLDEPIPREVVYTRVDTDEGIVGHGMAGGILGSAVAEFINRDLGPFLVGRDPFLTEGWWNEAYWRFNQRSLSGVVSCGMSGADIALWDVKG